MKTITIRTATFLVILSVLGLLITNVLYLHVHKLPDGTVVTHAHPFNKSQDQAPFKQHRHSLPEFIVLDHLQLLFGSVLLILLLTPFTKPVSFSLHSEQKGYCFFPALPVTRPPPAQDF